jgi:hypothetical protein|tara:strand:+ start:12 stop:116 length:105 start_codon:yes stop_codon:yes gene_type:complete
MWYLIETIQLKIVALKEVVRLVGKGIKLLIIERG